MKTCGNIAFLSTYPSRECGIATFTEDLIITLDHSGIINTSVIAVSNSENCSYSDKVTAQIRQDEQNDYIEMAKKLNTSNTDLLVIEHEFGIFGGAEGEYILDLINHLEIPFVTTLHSILMEPNPKQKMIINELGKKSEKIVTMGQNTKKMLQTIYGITEEKIEVISHGVPKKPLQPRETLKKKFGYENKQIITTFGLMRPDKGLEYGIEAISKIIMGIEANEFVMSDKRDVLYLILGQTHPGMQEEESAIYRNKLEELVNDRALNKNVKFINKHLTKDEIIQYLQLTDIFMTPYLSKDLSVSGTLAYAVGYSKAIVTTPYLYAEEMLTDGNGLFADFGDADGLADCIKQILQDPFKKSKMERDTAKIGRKMYWDKIALLYTKVLLSIITSEPKIGAV